MKRLVYLLALAAVACDGAAPGSGSAPASPALSAPPEAAARPAPAAAVAALSDAGCTTRHDVAPLGWTAALPCDYARSVAFENPSGAPEVIRQRVLFQGPTRAHLVVDAWDDDARRGLDAWLAAYRPFGLYSDAEVRGATRADDDARPAVRASTPGGNSPAKQIVMLAAGGHVYRLMYVDTDAGASAPAFRALVSTFDAEVTP